MFKNPFKKELIVSRRTFSYEKTGVNLSFTLNLSDKEEMKKFLDLLEQAVKDVQEEIDKCHILQS